MSEASARFFSTWSACRDAFRAQIAARADVDHSGALEIQPGYTLDYAWTGPGDAQHVLVYSSGLHGVEGVLACLRQREAAQRAAFRRSNHVVMRRAGERRPRRRPADPARQRGVLRHGQDVHRRALAVVRSSADRTALV